VGRFSASVGASSARIPTGALKRPTINRKPPLIRAGFEFLTTRWVYCWPILALSSASCESTSDSDSSFLKRSSMSSVSSWLSALASAS
jgi:hypothetical protein